MRLNRFNYCIECGFLERDHINERCPCPKCETVHDLGECPSEKKKESKEQSTTRPG